MGRTSASANAHCAPVIVLFAIRFTSITREKSYLDMIPAYFSALRGPPSTPWITEVV
jgi:hypothetical protein